MTPGGPGDPGSSTGAVVAMTHHGFESKGTLMRIGVHASAAHMLDVILVSFVVLEARRRKADRSRVAYAVAGAGGYSPGVNGGWAIGP